MKLYKIQQNEIQWNITHKFDRMNINHSNKLKACHFKKKKREEITINFLSVMYS